MTEVTVKKLKEMLADQNDDLIVVVHYGQGEYTTLSVNDCNVVKGIPLTGEDSWLVLQDSNTLSADAKKRRKDYLLIG